jgi:hypothetical protein
MTKIKEVTVPKSVKVAVDAVRQQYQAAIRIVGFQPGKRGQEA